MNPIIDRMEEEARACTSVMESAEVFIRGVPQLVADATAKALELGATQEQLAPFTQLEADLEDRRLRLAQAIVDNTPAAPSRKR